MDWKVYGERVRAGICFLQRIGVPERSILEEEGFNEGGGGGAVFLCNIWTLRYAN
jgi:hypothetical protein